MSVLIRDMKMPENCETCKYQTKGACFASGVNKGIITIKRMDKMRPEWCPLVEIKTPHGRLIDESIVLEMIRKAMGIKDLSFLYNAEKSVVNEIYHAPTVIEEE